MSSSDDDDDDVLLLNVGPAFKSKKAQKSRVRDLAFLDAALDNEYRKRKQDDALAKMQEEDDVDEEEQIRRAEAVIAVSDTKEGIAKKQRRTLANIENVDEEDENEKVSAMRSAAITGQSSLLGTRRTLRSTMDRCTYSETMKELKGCLRKIEKLHPNFSKPMKNAIRLGILETFLESTKLAKISREHNEAVPEELVKWLFRMSWRCVHSPEMEELRDGAFLTLKSLWASSTAIDEVSVTLSDLPLQLMSNLGLMTTHEIKTGVTAAPAPYEHQDALRNWLVLSSMLLSKGKHTRASKAEHTNSIKECVVALARAGLDRSFYSGHRLLQPLSSLLHTLVLEAKNTLQGETETVEWLQDVTNCIVQQSLSLGPSSPQSEDNDDKESLLSLALVVRLFAADGNGTLNENIGMLQALLCVRSLLICLGICSWDDKRERVLVQVNAPSRQKGDYDLRWLTLGAALVACERLSNEMGTSLMDGPRCLACVELVLQCIVTGIQLFAHSMPSYKDGRNKTDSTDEEEIREGPEVAQAYGSRHEAAAVLQLSLKMEEYCLTIEKSVKQLSTIPHFRRAESCLSSLRGYFRHFKSETSRMAGVRKSNSVQKGIESWFSSATE